MKRAFLSVYDKTGIVEFATGLHELGFELLSTGGTQKALEAAGLLVTNVSEITGFPECLDGRVKTLHPAIHAGILAMRGNPEHMAQVEQLGVGLIDIVAVNLYPFKATISKPDVTLEEAIENIDIGGPTMLRAAAKNWQDVASIVDPADYGRVLAELKEGGITRQTKFDLCVKVFEHTAAYDALISGWLRQQNGGGYPDKLTLTFEKLQDMRYGENPYQSAAFYKEPLNTEGTLAAAEQLWGKELSFNNINDTNGALDCLREFEDITVVASKHANPCGVGSGSSVYEAYMKAYNADPVSIFGGIVAVNAEVDKATAEEMVKTFLEIVIAPGFTDEALEVLKTKKNLRILRLPGISNRIPATALDIKKPLGGLIVQQVDDKLLEGELKVVTKKAPTEDQMKDLLFAWKLVKHLKSNAIAVAKDGQSLGLGPGQVSRIWAAENALQRAGEKARGSAMASDAYFPFDDCVRLAAEYGIAAIIQPGGSIRDEDSIRACDELGIAMVFTGMRHFKH
ncbi:MAG: bifunctional phosphoribosylaminoimidazolecarboxamide formyltransferase/IMP cyclohydrolase [Christensenellales bacterium]|jgi:phosphoribosylaminoimidazolecarboxamide formyltransferase/IMP cyclohydrolase